MSRTAISPSYRRKLLSVVEELIKAQLEEHSKRNMEIAVHVRHDDTGQPVAMSEEQQFWLGGCIAAATVLPLHKIKPKGTHSKILLTTEEAADIAAEVTLARPDFQGFPIAHDELARLIGAEAQVKRQAAEIARRRADAA